MDAPGPIGTVVVAVWAGHSGAPRAAIHGSGSTGWPDGAGRTSKWRCGPVELPVDPTTPICSPAATNTPSPTVIADGWAYQVFVPSRVRDLDAVPVRAVRPGVADLPTGRGQDWAAERCG